LPGPFGAGPYNQREYAYERRNQSPQLALRHQEIRPGQKLDEDKLNRILEAIRLAPTSSGLQPFEVFVVKNPELRAKIREVGWNQAQ
jgi:nitroreductase